MILGRPWLATADAIIGCRSGHKIISDGNVTKDLKLYSPKKLSPFEKPPPSEEPKFENGDARLVLTIDQALHFKTETEDNAINAFINDPSSVSDQTQGILESVMSCETQENIESEDDIGDIPVIPSHDSTQIEIELGKTLNINPNLSESRPNSC